MIFKEEGDSGMRNEQAKLQPVGRVKLGHLGLGWGCRGGACAGNEIRDHTAFLKRYLGTSVQVG